MSFTKNVNSFFKETGYKSKYKNKKPKTVNLPITPQDRYDGNNYYKFDGVLLPKSKAVYTKGSISDKVYNTDSVIAPQTKYMEERQNNAKRVTADTKDVTFSAMNNPQKAKGYIQTRAGAGKSSKEAEFKSYSQYVTVEEQNEYNRIYDTKGLDAANEYAWSLTADLKKRYLANIDKAKKEKAQTQINELKQYENKLADNKIIAEDVQFYDDFEQYSKPDRRMLSVNKDDEIYQAVNKTQAGFNYALGGGKKAVHKYYNQMTDYERAVYNYYYNKYGKEKADNYIKIIDFELDKRTSEQVSKGMREYTEENPAAAFVGHALYTPFTVAGNFETVKQNVSNKITGEKTPVNIYSDNFAAVRMREAISSTLTKDKGTIGSLLIGTGLSMADMAVALPFGSVAAPAILASNAAADAAYDATKRGASAGQALASGIASGAAEYFAERLPIENLFKIAKMPKAGFKKYALNICKQAHLEGSEEFVTQILNNISDSLIMGENSNYNNRVNEYVANGMSRTKAEAAAFSDLYIKDTALAYAGGAISGGIFGAAGSVKSAVSGDGVNLPKKAQKQVNLPKQPMQQTEINLPRKPGQIYMDMPDAERATILKNKTVDVIDYKDGVNDLTADEIAPLERKYKSQAQKILTKFAQKLGVLKKYNNKEIELDFNYSKSSLVESTHQQSERNADYKNFAKMLSVFDDLVKNAQPIEIHSDKYVNTRRENPNLKQVYVLMSAFRDGDSIVPVEFNIKEFKEGTENKLYMSVVLHKTRVGGSLVLPSESQENTNTAQLSKISLTDIIKNVNSEDVDFLKYIPNELLSEEQLQGKAIGLEKERVKIENLRNKTQVDSGSDANYFEEFEMLHRKLAAKDAGHDINKPLYARADAATRLQRDIQNVAKRLGLDVTYFENTSNAYDGTDFDFNGAYSKGHIYINLNAKNPLKVVFGHEIVHQIKDTDIDSYNRLVDIVRNELGADSDFDNLDGLQQEETISDVMGDILDNPSKYNEVFRQNETLLQRIITIVRDMINKLTGENTSLDDDVSKYTQKLKNVENELVKIMKQSVGSLGSKTDVKYSGEVRKSTKEIKGKNGNYGIGVYLDTDLFKGIHPRNWNKPFVKFVYDNLAGNDIKVFDDNGNEEIIFFAREKDRTKKDGAKNSHFVIDKLARATNNTKKLAIVHIDELLETAVHDNYSTEHSHQWLDENGWEYRKTYIQDINNNIYEATLNIAKARDGRNILYDISNIKKVDVGVVSSTQNERDSLTNRQPNDTVPQNEEIVKPENNAKKSQKTSKLYDNTLQKPWVTEDTKKVLEENKDRFMYEGISNKETYEAAKAEVDTVGVEAAERNLYVKQDWDAVDTAKALNLVSRYQNIGEHSKAVDVASVLRERLTQAGQAIQAAAIADKLTPEGQLIDFTRNAEKLINDQIEKHPQKDKIKQELKEARKKDREVEKQKKADNINLPKKPPTAKPKVNLPKTKTKNDSNQKSFVEQVYEKYNIKHIDQATMDVVAENLKTLEMLNDKNDLIDLIISQSKKRRTVANKQVISALKKQNVVYLKDVAVEQIFGMIADKYPKSFAEKLSTTQVMSHLLNAKTMLRNLVSNSLFDVVETFAYDVGCFTDWILSAFTKKRTVGFDRGWGEKGRLPAANKRGRESYLEIALDLPRTKSGSKYQLDQSGRILKKGPMAMGERWTSYGLQTTDEWQKGAIEHSVRKSYERLKNNGFTQEEIDAAIDEEVRYRTFQDDNMMSKMLQIMNEGLNLIGGGKIVRGSVVRWTRQFGLGDLVQKYTQVPGALIARSVEFSPLGYFKAISALLCSVAKNKGLLPKQQRKLALSMARATTGTGLSFAFYVLARLGILIGEKDDEDKRLKALENSDGISGMQINTSALNRLISGENPEIQKGDKLLSVGFLEPINTLMASGYDLYVMLKENARKTDTERKDLFSIVLAVLQSKTFNQIADIPTMQSLRTLVDTINYGGNAVDLAVSYGADAVTGFVPSPVRQLGSFLDPIQRNPYNEETSVKKGIERAKAAIPYIRKDVAAKVTPFGDEKSTSTGNRGLDFLNNFINPGNINQYTPSELSEELYKMSEYDMDVLPKVPAKSFKDKEGNTYAPKGKNYEEYSKLVGKETEKALKTIINSAEYKKMSAMEKVEALADAVDNAETEAKKQYILKHGDYGNRWDLELTYLSDEAQTKAKKVRMLGINSEAFVKAYNAQSGVKGDKDVYLSSSRKKKSAIDKAVPHLTKAQRQKLYEVFGVSKKVW